MTSETIDLGKAAKEATQKKQIEEFAKELEDLQKKHKLVLYPCLDIKPTGINAVIQIIDAPKV
jgi:hypothetical protein